MAYGTFTLTGHHTDPSGDPHAGAVIITPNATILDLTGNTVMSGVVRVTLDETGEWTVELPCDSAELNPSEDIGYRIGYALQGTSLPGQSFYATADMAGTTLDVSDIVTVTVPSLLSTTLSDTAIATAVSTVGTETQAALEDYVGAIVDPRAHLVELDGTAAENVTALQAAITAAAAAGAPLLVRGGGDLDEEVYAPANSDIDFSLSPITMTADLTPVIVVDSVSNVRIRNLRVNGKTSDYVNSSTVYNAAAVRVIGTASDVLVEDSTFLGMAGLGVFIGAGTSDVTVRGCRMTGAGSAYITSTTYNYSAGVAIDPGAVRPAVLHNQISGFSQGIVAGDNTVDVRVVGNLIHDIPGQHGIYLSTLTGGTIADNIVRNTALLGMKIQIGSTDATDATDVIISGNTFRTCGAQGILLDNPLNATVPKFRRVVIADNVVQASAGHGIEARSAIGLHIADNLINGVTGGAGIRVVSSSVLSVVDNRINTVSQMGIDISSVQDYELRGNRIINPATANGTSSEWGIGIDGATTAEGVIDGNRITDANGNMRYGIGAFGSPTAAPVMTSHTFRNNYVSGATDYGFRGPGSVTCREWSNNDVSGTTGRTLNAPTSGLGRVAVQSYGTAAPTTGAHDRGEIVWNTAPAASGTVGWVCTTAGTPGTWKTFGAISA